jgi:ABC-type antimicrobial peptide transport system permease subunit
LGLKIGDTLLIRDGQGRERNLRFVATLAGSLFQGSVIIGEKDFLALFPSATGFSRFLVDAPSLSTEQRVSSVPHLENLLRNFGAQVMTTEAKLFMYQQVENTYLVMFLLLGGFGLLIGVGGFGVFIQRTIASRRGEFALLVAVGFQKWTISGAVFWEHLVILASALLTGMAAALLALIPAILKAGNQVPWAILAFLFCGMAAGGFLWVRRTVRAGLKGDLISILKNE